MTASTDRRWALSVECPKCGAHEGQKCLGLPGQFIFGACPERRKLIPLKTTPTEKGNWQEAKPKRAKKRVFRPKYEVGSPRCKQGRHAECNYVTCRCDCHRGRRA